MPTRARLVQRYRGRVQRIAPTEEGSIRTDDTFRIMGDHLVISHLEEERRETEGYDTRLTKRRINLLNGAIALARR